MESISHGGKLLGNILESFIDIVGNIVEWGIGLIASGFIFLNQLLCDIAPRPAPPQKTDKPIEHVSHIFVLMMENRSFDHLLNDFNRDPSAQTNIDINSGSYAQDIGSPQRPTGDPPHRFADIQLQIKGWKPMKGFVKNWQRHLMTVEGVAPTAERLKEVMLRFKKDRAPIINQLAEEFAVCRNWFSSVPGSTYCNRLFLYAGDSGGLADDPRGHILAGHYLDGISFENGNLFQRLDNDCEAWRVYHGDNEPMVSTLRNIWMSGAGEYRDIDPINLEQDDFKKDLEAADHQYPAFTLIEPDYAYLDNSDFSEGNSQHPKGNLVDGERLIKHVYESIRNSPIWENSLLIITYDEHGGYFDRVEPPAAVPPGGDNRHRDMHKDVDYGFYLNSANFAGPNSADGMHSLDRDDLDPNKFKFDRLGVRVPAVVVSPFIEKGTRGDAVYDHTSVLRTFCERFDKRHFTERDKNANSLASLLTRNTPRTDTPSRLVPVEES